MNANIMEVYKTAFDNADYPIGERYRIEPSQAFCKKFAELIIEECLKMCDVAQMGHLTHGQVAQAQGCESAKAYIKEWFEVK